MKIIEASIINKGKKVYLLVEWKANENGKTFRTDRTISAEDLLYLTVDKHEKRM